jgi:hypothetical protein
MRSYRKRSPMTVGEGTTDHMGNEYGTHKNDSGPKKEQ